MQQGSEKQIMAHVLKKLITFYGNTRFTVVLRRTRCLLYKKLSKVLKTILLQIFLNIAQLLDIGLLCIHM
jgi:hypothetical protein